MTHPRLPAQKTQMTPELAFQVFLARLFGQKRQFTDNGYLATCYYFRGVVYLTEVRPLGPGE